MAHETLQTVELQRSVRYGRILIGGAVLGGAVASLVTLLFPVKEGALYTMGQIVGFMLLVGGVIGLALGGLLALVLTLVARRNRGSGVIAVEAVEDLPAPEEAAELDEDETVDPVGAADIESDAEPETDAEPSDPPPARAD